VVLPSAHVADITSNKGTGTRLRVCDNALPFLALLSTCLPPGHTCRYSAAAQPTIENQNAAGCSFLGANVVAVVGDMGDGDEKK
jgi:hypothetical protein